MSKRRKKKLDPITLNIESLSHEGRGVARSEDGRVVFVSGALPGETVLAKVDRQKRQLIEASVLEVLTASEKRVEPPCQYATLCGGCNLQHLSNEDQVEHKQHVLKEQLKHFGQSSPEQGYFDPLFGDTLGYRRKARLACKYVLARERVLVGFREASSHFIANIDACPVLDQRVGSLLPALSEMMTQLTLKDKIPQIEVAAGDDQLAFVVRHLEPMGQEDLNAWVSFCQEHDIDLYLQPSGLDSVHKVWPEDGNTRLSVSLPELSLEYRFHPLDFLQVNKSINDKLVPWAVKLLAIEPHETVVDLFCGLGNFTLALAQIANEVIGVECSTQMVERVLENADHNGLSNIKAYQADLSADFTDQEWVKPCDKLLIDPPRSGAAAVVEQIDRLSPQKIVYVSCNPATLARDIGALKSKGYRLLQVGAVDMFPHTKHVESVAVLERDAK